MSWFDGTRARLRLLVARRAAESRIDEELRFHVEMETERLMRDEGCSADEARRRALVAFGGVAQHRETLRDGRGLAWLDGLSLDFTLAGRMLRKHPGLTVVATIAVAFAIAVGTVTFEVAKQYFFPSIPLPDGNSIVALRNWDVGYRGAVASSRRDYASWKQGVTTVTDLSAVMLQDRNVDVGAAIGGSEPIEVADVTASMFAMTRVAASIGRTLLPEDEAPGAEDVAVIGYDFWQTKLAGTMDVLSRTIRVSGRPARIVGVMPRGFGFPRRNDVWRPLHLEQLPDALPRLTQVFGHLAPGRTISEARAELAALGARMASLYPETHRNLRGQVVRLPVAVTRFDPTEATWALGSINIFLVLLLALICGNVALLLFARAVSRHAEIVVRTALGASRGRIVLQLFAEALLLCGVGAAVGLLAANVLVRWFWVAAASQSGALPFWVGGSLSPSTIGYSLWLTLLAAAIAGVIPALKVTSGGVDVRLRAMSTGGGGLQFGGVWTTIIVAQIALTLTVPMVTSFIRADFVRMRDTPAGFAADHFLTATLALDRADGAAALGDTSASARAARIEARYLLLAERLRAEPGVAEVTYADRMPLVDQTFRSIEMDAGPASPPDPNYPDSRPVGAALVAPGFFDAIGAPVIRGRSLTTADAEGNTSAVLVNESFVNRVTGGQNPVGRQVRFRPRCRGCDPSSPEGAPGPWMQIVGVVPDLGITDTSYYRAARVFQPATPKQTSPLRIAIALRGDPLRFATRLRELAAAVDPGLRIVNPLPMPRELDADVAFHAFWYHVLVVFALVVVGLSSAGIYAVTAFTVSKRTREIGIRVALGAPPLRVIGAVFKRPLIQIALGIGVGVVMMVSILTQGDFRVKMSDVVTIAQFLAGISAVCALACLLPARRALGIQPTEALKDEG